MLRGGTGQAQVIITTIMRHAGGTGVQTHVQTFEEYLQDQNVPYAFVNPFLSRSPLLVPVFGFRRVVEKVSRPLGVWWYRGWHARFLRRPLRRACEQAAADAVVYAQCPVSADVALAVRRPGQRVVMVAHFNVSQADEWAGKGELAYGGRIFRAIRALEARVFPRLDGIVYVSEFSRGVIEDTHPELAARPAEVIPNPVAASTATQPPTERRDLITIGSLEARKNQTYLLEVLARAAAHGHRFTLTVVGDGPDRPALEARCRELGIDSQVRFLGYVPDARALIGGHRLYVHAATMESFGIVLVEAMAEGVPTVSAAVGGIPEVVREGVDGRFWPLDDPERAAEVVIAILSDPAALQAMSTAAKESAATRFSVDGVFAELLRFFDRVPAGAGAPSQRVREGNARSSTER